MRRDLTNWRFGSKKAYRKILMSDWEWLQRATTIENDGFYIRYKVFGITVAKHEAVRY